MKRRWSKIRPGDVVELGGRAWTVAKIKPKGKALRVVVRSGSHRAESKVDPADKVRIAEAAKDQAKPVAKLPPPAPATGSPWETQADRVERKLDEILGARLIAESTNGERSWYVPMADVGTIAAHLALFHGGRHLDAASEDQMLTLHAREHVKDGAPAWAGTPPHTHTEQRPAKGKKK